MYIAKLYTETIFMKPTLLFYDYETFGTSPSLDRPAQFAAIRTDMDLNVIGEPETIYCCLANDYLPQPEAVLITGITPQIAQLRGINEASFTRRIHQIFCVPNTCIVGYNNICFDDEISRNLFYRNFYDPYDWSWKNSNSRWDLLDVVRACFALRPDGIRWPTDTQGCPTFRLEKLTQENQIAHNSAHDALSDVYATIALAKLIKEKQPKLYNFLYAHRQKHKLRTLINVSQMKQLVFVSSRFGKKRSNVTCVAPLAWHPHNKNALITCDLGGDVSSLIAIDTDLLRESLDNYHKLAQHRSNFPLQLIHINKCPVIAPANVLRASDALRIGINLEYYADNLAKLLQNPKIREKVAQLYIIKEKHIPLEDVDTQMYHGFFNYSDRHTIHTICHTSAKHLLTLNLTFYDKRIKQLFFRFRARNFPDLLTPLEKIAWLQHRREILNKKRIQEYIKNIESLHTQYQYDQVKQAHLEALLDYTKDIQFSLQTEYL
ncbi:Exodeoxyribonuclease I [Candidatus Erwinia haradaeae]|uniref:Exodeoxyribonuclease I n=2 Tax=Candidatus Erwinia haradaeae TaxID=1922217 RepID=A0A451DIU4_9GAMM|nr:Exodeoxyribonuclease I [Candidatus Erwinia haradaeae]